MFETALVSGIQQENDFVAVWNSFLDFKRRAYTASGIYLYSPLLICSVCWTPLMFFFFFFLVNNKADSEANATAIREALQRYHDYFTQCMFLILEKIVHY